MRFYPLLLFSSFLLTVLAAPHAQLNDISTNLERRGQAAVGTPTQDSASSLQPSASAKAKVETYLKLKLDQKNIGEQVLDNHDYQFFDYSLSEYDGKKDLILRQFGKGQQAEFEQEIKKIQFADKGKAVSQFVAAGVYYDTRNSKLSSLTKGKLSGHKDLTYVIILNKSAAFAGSYLES
ncbi:uncharacterized protein C8R40DRAFT_1172352 [Lentinula edodes]|uniref:uncharacterized protein n=1 Tax=Lentinula edodes TaxID=5353 RepID=UPI001E8D5DC0|nr:uncharacterized protein C8R40DRAFT_1172352 [Lentinula edodes]KAH7873567.1 hypothetical protein C8R40DRAFT_1172352 [Lentinula edodes]